MPLRHATAGLFQALIDVFIYARTRKLGGRDQLCLAKHAKQVPSAVAMNIDRSWLRVDANIVFDEKRQRAPQRECFRRLHGAIGGNSSVDFDFSSNFKCGALFGLLGAGVVSFAGCVVSGEPPNTAA